MSGRWLDSTLALFGAALLCRMAGPWFGILNIDEVDFALIGRSVAEGHLPYAELVDIKTPLVYVAFAPAAIGGELSLLPMHLLGVVLVVATGHLLGRAVARWTRNESAARAAPWLYLLATLCDVPAVNAELLLNFPTAAALWFVAVAEAGTLAFDFLAGAAIGVASLVKHQGGMPLASFGLVLSVRAVRTRSTPTFLRVAMLVAGFLAPWLLTIAVYAHAGFLEEFWDWVFVRNFGYVGEATHDTAVGARFLASTLVCVGGTLGIWISALAESRRPSTIGSSPMRGMLLAGLWLTWLPVAMGGRFYEHYYLQFAPFLAVLAAPRVGVWLEAWPRLPSRFRAKIWVLGLAPALAGCTFFVGKGLAGAYPADDEKVVEVASFLRAATRPDETMFVWGHTSPLYLLANRRPGTRYFHCSVHVGNFDPGHVPDGFDASRHVSKRDVDATILDLETNAVPIFVDLAPSAIHHWDRMPLSAIPELERYLAEHYTPFGRPAGAVVYRRKGGRA